MAILLKKAQYRSTQWAVDQYVDKEGRKHITCSGTAACHDQHNIIRIQCFCSIWTIQKLLPYSYSARQSWSTFLQTCSHNASLSHIDGPRDPRGTHRYPPGSALPGWGHLVTLKLSFRPPLLSNYWPKMIGVKMLVLIMQAPGNQRRRSTCQARRRLHRSDTEQGIEARKSSPNLWRWLW